jgi:hypothetical protein
MEIDVTKKDEYLSDAEKYKKLYKEEKEKLEWADDDFEESLIQEKMDEYASLVKDFKAKVALIETQLQEKKA